jgi:prepilin-type N-terminal cleavage/methylation domain-containing protein
MRELNPAIPRRSGDAGFTLLECIVALLLISLIATSLMSSMGLALGATSAAENHTGLVNRAVAELEILNSLPFGDTRLVAGGALDASVTEYSIDPLPENPAGYLRWQVVDERPGLKRLRLVAGEQIPGRSEPREIILETFRIETE